MKNMHVLYTQQIMDLILVYYWYMYVILYVSKTPNFLHNQKRDNNTLFNYVWLSTRS